MKWTDRAYQELSRDELFQIYKLRAIVFNDEQQSSYPDPDDQDQHAHHVFATQDGQLAAYACYFVGDGKATFGRVLVAKPFRGQGLAKELIKHVMAGIRQHYGHLLIEIHSQVYVKQLYQHFGFQAVGPVFTEAQRQHVLMTHAPLVN